MPIFTYACPVTATAAALLSLCGLVFESRRLVGDDCKGMVGWLLSPHYAPLVLYLGVVPGIVGHTGAFTCDDNTTVELRRLEPVPRVVRAVSQHIASLRTSRVYDCARLEH